MRINSEEAMIEAIRIKQKEDVSWIELLQRSRANTKKAAQDTSEKPDKNLTASRIAGA